MKAISKLRQCFSEHIDDFLFIFGLILATFGLFLVALAFAVMFSDSVACYLQELLGLDEKSDVLKFIGFCIAGVASIWLALAANKRAKAMEDTAKEQANATKNTEKGQRQERLKNAIEHLGHDRDSVRMGGAHELFHLAKDTGDLRQTVMDILCAHIRQMTGGDYQKRHSTKPSEEIQGLLTLLFIEEHDVFKDCSINLQGSYLNGATLSQARLKRANLRQAQLLGTNLEQVQLQEASLNEAHLRGSDLSSAELQVSNLTNAHLQGAKLWWARLQGTDLMNAQLQGASLVFAQSQGASLVFTQLQGISRGVLKGFENQIGIRTSEASDLTEIIFSGGLKQEDLDALCEGLSAEKAQALREILRPHVGKPASNELPENSGAVIGTYTKEEAEQWIAEYQEAMRGGPKRDDG